MRVLLFGMEGPFAQAALTSLLATGHRPCALVLPASRAAPAAIRRVAPPAGTIVLGQLATHPSLGAQALEYGIPLFELAQPAAPEALAALTALQPDVACVACWPQRIPPALLDVPLHGFFNLHPSLLPAFRGPEPLFWTLRAGAPVGVTIHRMDAGLDTGPIAAQATLTLPDGLELGALEQRCAQTAAALLSDVLTRLAAGSLELRPQAGAGTYHGEPTASDFALDTAWSARRVFNFMRAAQAWGEPFTVTIGRETLHLAAAQGFDPAARLGAAWVRAGAQVQVQFEPGVLTALAWNLPSPSVGEG